MRGSKKLHSLANNIKSKSAAINGALTEERIPAYSNQCYMISDISFRENLSEYQGLDQVIDSAYRVADHLEKNEGREEESKLIREYFKKEPIQQAIEATAISRSTKVLKLIFLLTFKVRVFRCQISSHKISSTPSPDYDTGATVRNDGDRVVIGRVVKGGLAERSQLFHDGDELLEVNGYDLRGRNVTEVCDILRSMLGEISLVVVPSNKSESQMSEKQSTSTKHLRALFDYDPEDDMYVPCRELALKFQRGDILHVINTSDENWWQAYRDGDDPSSSLAGLIPSMSFQQQVVMHNRKLEQENETDVEKRKDFFGCARKRSVKISKSQKATMDLKPADEILTYEDVSLFLSKTGKKRPIVLCGPEGVGCLELRQRLAETDKILVSDTTRPKKNEEIDGVHFHFVTKQKFQDDARGGKFIEYGEYQKYLYGTSIAAIKAVVDRAKICVLTLKSENLRALRKTTLMPYVIFIAPPSLQQLRHQKESIGQHNIKDDQLKLILNEGKMIEQQYGHLFDKIIVNVDLDRSLNELKELVQRLETEPQWVPSFWLNNSNLISNDFIN
ncbi:unnamed protein product [Dracunculus medinensis]|uniref:MAGUK p55 subfamily member 5 n=1 Tax=Dracunculus medinensis TaxID=318479 RepID=A0A3P7SKR1_DRAME|nr:unnamed protein product [Dracunculus medinensis]